MEIVLTEETYVSDLTDIIEVLCIYSLHIVVAYRVVVGRLSIVKCSTWARFDGYITRVPKVSLFKTYYRNAFVVYV